MSIDKYAERTLFERVGIDRYHWRALSSQVHTGGGLYLRPRDMLKLGQLVLDAGRWNGQQVVSEAWVEESTAFRLPVGGISERDQALRALILLPPEPEKRGYGYQWWLETLVVERERYPAVHASGYGRQLMWVIPDLDLVVLFLHHNPTDGRAR